MLHQYFKERKGFNRLFQLLKEKNISLNRFLGTVTLTNITKEESKDLSAFFGKVIKENSNFQTSFSKIEKKLKETKYKDFTWEDLFNNYFQEEIITKKQLRTTFKAEESHFYQEILEKAPESLKVWLKKTIEEKDKIYQTFLRRYKKDKEGFKNDLSCILKLIERTNKKKTISLTMLASQTGNPHFLDLATANSNLFLKLLADYNQLLEPKSTEEKIMFLKDFNIYIDELSNFVIIYNLQSSSNLIMSFYKEKEPLNLSLSNLSKIKDLDTENKKVYIFENPSMLMALKEYDIPIVISYGNPNYVFYKILDKLTKNNNTIYYNGDFDPEGLQIANNIYKRYPKVKLFCYHQDDYNNSKSNEKIKESRLKILNQIRNQDLQEMINILKKEKIAAYQEKNIENIKRFIEEEKVKGI